MDADYAFFQKMGNSVTAAVANIEGVINGVNLIYERDVQIRHRITTIIVRSDTNTPYTSTAPSTLLSQFRTQWNLHHSDIRRDIAHLMTGIDLDQNWVGWSYIGVICSDTRSGAPAPTVRARSAGPPRHGRSQGRARPPPVSVSSAARSIA